MNAISRFFRQASMLLGRKRFAGELDEEMAFHRQQAEIDYIAAGMTPEEARYAAMRQFGNATKLRELEEVSRCNVANVGAVVLRR